MGKEANGSVVGNDIRVIAKHPDMTVDILGIDNHDVAHVPLVAAGGVMLTTSGEVITSMHQHACHRKNKSIH